MKIKSRKSKVFSYSVLLSCFAWSSIGFAGDYLKAPVEPPVIFKDDFIKEEPVKEDFNKDEYLKEDLKEGDVAKEEMLKEDPRLTPWDEPKVPEINDSGSAGSSGGERPIESCWTLPQNPGASVRAVNAWPGGYSSPDYYMRLAFLGSEILHTEHGFSPYSLVAGLPTLTVDTTDFWGEPFGVQYEVKNPNTYDHGKRGCMIVQRQSGDMERNISTNFYTSSLLYPLNGYAEYESIQTLKITMDPDNRLVETNEADNMIECTSLIRGCRYTKLSYGVPFSKP
ncbi:MAG: hypothetical protein IPJ69_14865 [Deltaproteobacteria bacterium]|nr:MAG: hypothetical protein IPJ69_14865 [Deltaproteobacteria bacterium]